MAKVKAIVRGPEAYFDGVLHAPGSIVEVDEAFVSEADTVEVEVKVRLAQPLLGEDGKPVRELTETIKKRTRFRPLSNVDIATAQPDPRVVVPQSPDRMNVTDFLKQSLADIEEKISSGAYDDFLDVIAQAEIVGKGRKGVAEAIEARQRAA